MVLDHTADTHKRAREDNLGAQRLAISSQYDNIVCKTNLPATTEQMQSPQKSCEMVVVNWKSRKLYHKNRASLRRK